MNRMWGSFVSVRGSELIRRSPRSGSTYTVPLSEFVIEAYSSVTPSVSARSPSSFISKPYAGESGTPGSVAISASSRKRSHRAAASHSSKALAVRLLAEQQMVTVRWTKWAEEVVSGWDDPWRADAASGSRETLRPPAKGFHRRLISLRDHPISRWVLWAQQRW